MLREREKTILFSGGIVAAIIVLVAFVILPGAGKIASQRRILTQTEKNLAEFRSLRPELRRLDAEVSRRTSRVRSQPKTNDSPLSRLTNVMREAGLPQASFSLKSGGVKEGEFFKEEAFDLKIENRSYLDVVRLLQRTGNGPYPLVVRSINLKSRYENSNYLDAVIRIGFLMPR